MFIIDLAFTGFLVVFCCLAVWVKFHYWWQKVATWLALALLKAPSILVLVIFRRIKL